MREWCRYSRIGISYIEPGSPWENPWVESFNGRVRDELLNVEELGSLIEAHVVVEAWRIEYNADRPGALGVTTCLLRQLGAHPRGQPPRTDEKWPVTGVCRA